MKHLLPLDEVRLGRRLLGHWARRRRDDVFDLVKLKLFVTKRCNLRCRHCGIGDAAFDGHDDLSTDQVRRLWAANPEIQLLSLSGGEPFVRDDMAEIGVAAARSLPRLLALTVNTNGWDTDRIVAFAEAVLPELPPRCQLFVTCSSDGPPDRHAEVRRSEESYGRKEATLEALRGLRGRWPRLAVRHNVNVNRWNLDVIADYIEGLEARGEECFVSVYSASKHYSHTREHFAELKRFRRELTGQADVIRRLRERPGFLSNRFLTLAEDFYATYERSQPVPCFSLRASLIVEHDGMVRPCINFPVDLGRVQDHAFRLRDVVSTPQADHLRAKIREETCPVCWTPNEAYVTMMCNLPNPALWRRPGEALGRLGAVRR